MNVDKFGNEFEVKDNYLIQYTRWDRVDKFELVDKIPNDYIIWNIGKNMVDGYLPLAKSLGNHKVDLTNMKAIKTENAQIILDGINGGNTLKTLQEHINKINSGIKKDKYKYNETLVAIELLKPLY